MIVNKVKGINFKGISGIITISLTVQLSTANYTYIASLIFLSIRDKKLTKCNYMLWREHPLKIQKCPHKERYILRWARWFGYNFKEKQSKYHNTWSLRCIG